MTDFVEIDERTSEKATLLHYNKNKDTSFSRHGNAKAHDGYHSTTSHSSYQATASHRRISGQGLESNGYGPGHGQPTNMSPRTMNTRKRHSSLNFDAIGDQITLSWENVNVFVPPPSKKWYKFWKKGTGETKQILDNVSGAVKPGTLLAMLGASGAGKTTLLNVLNGRNISNLIVDGDVRVNGMRIGKGITSLSAYVQQDDLFVGSLKVKEHLMFQALLRMDAGISYEGRMARVKEVMLDMGLNKCADTPIGVPGRIKGISGGEMKRLSFASEVLTNPPLFFVDEPTSGLDSYMAQSVVEVLQKMAARGCTILCTIHQPSSDVYEMFDRILLMSEGRVAYMGPAKKTLPFFESAGYICPVNYNPCDFFIHTLAIVPGEEKECKEVVTRICDTYQESKYRQEIEQSLPTDAYKDLHVDDVAFDDRSPYKASWPQQFKAVLWRCIISNARNPAVTRIRFIQTFVIAIIIGLIYIQQDNSQEAVQNINGAMFMWLTNMTFSNVINVVNTFPVEMPTFRREHHNGMYRVDIYFLCKMVAEIPIFLALPVLFVCITYWMIGLVATFENFMVAMAVVVMVTMVAVSFGYMLSCVTDDVVVSSAISPPLLIPLLLFGGFFLNNSSIPPYLKWLSYLSWFTYANEILVINQWSEYGNITCLSSDSRCYNSGEDVIESLSFSSDALWTNWVFMVVLMVGFRVIAYLFLLARSYKK